MAIPKDLTKGNYHYLYMAKLAEQAERYEDMANYMNKLVINATASGRELTVEERNLLSSAYKNVVDSLRAARLMVSSVDQKEKVRNNVVSDYRSKVESELSDFCTSVINLLDDNLLPSTVDNESKVFYLKMKGDYHRYLAEFKTGDERKSAVDDTVNAYKTAALTGLRPTHPIRLGVALNFAVFYYEVLNAADEACTMAEQAFVEAMEELDLLRKGDGAYKDSTLIMRLLRDNLVVWTSDRQVYSNYND